MIFKELIEWSLNSFNELPWRKGRTPYTTLVSEIMLQQTNVSTVLKHYDRFLQKFPDLKSLATASQEEVVKNWQGLGYYRRARNLHAACITINQEYGGKFPESYDELLKIKGIGDYTASAILSLCFQQNLLAMDANIERVLSRFFRSDKFKGNKNIKFLKNEFFSKFNSLKIHFGDLNEAFMDVGRTYCTARSANCLICPLNQNCSSAYFQDATNYPLQPVGKEKKYFSLKLLRVIQKNSDKFLFFKRPKGKWLEGQLELPSFIIESEDSSLKQYPRAGKSDFLKLPIIKTSITKYKIENLVLNDSNKSLRFEGSGGVWLSKNQALKEHLSSTTLKILNW